MTFVRFFVESHLLKKKSDFFIVINVTKELKTLNFIKIKINLSEHLIFISFTKIIKSGKILFMTQTVKTSQMFDIFNGDFERLSGIKVLLINPPERLSEKTLYPPLDLMSLAAVLEKSGAQVEILDLNMLRLNFEEVKKAISASKFDLICIDGFANVYNYIKSLVGYLKSEYPNLPLIGSGKICTGSPDIIIKNTKLDALIIGEGESVIIDLVDSLLHSKDITKIYGVVYRHNNEVFKTPTRPRIENMDQLPIPAYHLVNLEQYIINAKAYEKRNELVEERINDLNLDREKAQRRVVLYTKRGCPFKCDFCFRNFGRRVISHSVKYVLDHMRYLEEKYNSIFFSIEDETFNTDNKWVEEFCDTLISEKRNYIITLRNGLRANLIDDNLIKKMKKAGFCSIGVEIDSFYDPVLKEMLKLQTSEMIVNAIQTIKRHGFDLSSAKILYGYPSDNEESMNVNVEMCKKLGLKNVRFEIPCPYPGTALYQRVLKLGLIADEEAWLMELSDTDTCSRMINISGKSDEFLQKQIKLAQDKVRIHFSERI